jgi:DNA-binding response OmpR family regulator
LRLPALEAGAYDFIAKPFDASDLMVRVRKMLHARLQRKHLDEHDQRCPHTRTALRDPGRLPARDPAMDGMALATGHGKGAATPTGRWTGRGL